jgi:hypothetical protein
MKGLRQRWLICRNIQQEGEGKTDLAPTGLLTVGLGGTPLPTVLERVRGPLRFPPLRLISRQPDHLGLSLGVPAPVWC